MGLGPDRASGQQKAEYVSRPTLGDLLAKDIFVYAVASGIAAVWVVYVALFYLMEDDTTAEGGLSQDWLFFIFLLMTIGDIAIISFRVRHFSTFVNRGVETPAKITGITTVGDQIGLEYEYQFNTEHLKGNIGLGGFATRKKAEQLQGREILIFVDPEKPKRVLVLSKLR